MAICAALESEIAVLSDEEKQEFLADIGHDRTGTQSSHSRSLSAAGACRPILRRE